jgi:hypothetical protein
MILAWMHSTPHYGSAGTLCHGSGLQIITYIFC